MDDETQRELRRLQKLNERLQQINEWHQMKLSVRGFELQIADLTDAVFDLKKQLCDANATIAKLRGTPITEQELSCPTPSAQ